MLNLLWIISCVIASSINLGRESDQLILTNGGTEWVQVQSPSGGYDYNRFTRFDPVLSLVLTETRFQIFTPFEGDTIIPDTMTFINWKTYPCIGCDSPTDVRIILMCKKWALPNSWSEDTNEVSILAHSVPNVGAWLWMTRVPRAWSNDDFYFLRICSLENDNECSDSHMFRINNPYSFYP